MAKAIKPDALRIAVQKQLQLQKDKALKSDVFRFVNWLRQYAAGFQMYVGLDETPTPAVAPKGEAQRAGRGGGGSRVTAGLSQMLVRKATEKAAR
ncbi:unnamed protein product, partial [Aphanomyces euteiches]